MLGRYAMTKNWYGIGQDEVADDVTAEAGGDPAPAVAETPPPAAGPADAWYKKLSWWQWTLIIGAGWMVVRRFGREKEAPESDIGPRPKGLLGTAIWGVRKAYRKVPRGMRQAAESSVKAKLARRVGEAGASAERVEERWWKHGMRRAEEKMGPKEARKATKRRRKTRKVKAIA